MPAILPLNIKNSAAAIPIIRPPAGDIHGVKLFQSVVIARS